MPRGMEVKAPVFCTSWVTAAVVAPTALVEGGIWEELFCMVRVGIETQPYLIEQKKTKENNPNTGTLGKKREEIKPVNKLALDGDRNRNCECQINDLMRGGVSRPSLRQRARSK